MILIKIIRKCHLSSVPESSSSEFLSGNILKSIELVKSRSPTKSFIKQKPVGPFVGKVLIEANDNLLSETYYHGIVSRVDMEKMLIRDGDFLLGIPEEDEQEFQNNNEPNELQSILWIVRYSNDLWAFNIGLTEKNLCFVNQKCFKKITEMVSHYVRTRKSIHEVLPIVVKRPIPHPVSCFYPFTRNLKS
ncbi:unnamed protein product [Onchocerca flexuosa]|uniref:SH2 domain-containing protein n=1 Tax=Onchocerca flexuosa TaxID=387005 RepID=A0A183HCX6_9BILA|nr:unnamed protein product [Onchocerca flexuosa]